MNPKMMLNFYFCLEFIYLLLLDRGDEQKI
ncbi:Uncharacterised protein [Pasteurella multocida subsp. septica]|nr:Uncharacterised protein [Pasteurella multocida subsp. septica]SUB46354.1 Uncharacterised protein [Pasteurella multocida subsp. septica]